MDKPVLVWDHSFQTIKGQVHVEVKKHSAIGDAPFFLATVYRTSDMKPIVFGNSKKDVMAAIINVYTDLLKVAIAKWP